MMLTELECTEHIELKWFKLFIKCRKYSITIKKLRICRFYFGILKKYAGGRQGTKIWGVPNVLATMAAPFWTPWDKHPGFTKCFGTYGCPTGDALGGESEGLLILWSICTPHPPSTPQWIQLHTRNCAVSSWKGHKNLEIRGHKKLKYLVGNSMMKGLGEFWHL